MSLDITYKHEVFILNLNIKSKIIYFNYIQTSNIPYSSANTEKYIKSFTTIEYTLPDNDLYPWCLGNTICEDFRRRNERRADVHVHRTLHPTNASVLL